MRHPDEILKDIKGFTDGSNDDYDRLHGYIWEIIEDVIDSARLAVDSLECLESDEVEDVVTTIEDYVSNHYGVD